MQKGDIVKGHFCYACLKAVDSQKASPSNPRRTDWCLRCGHRGEGLQSSALAGDGLVLGPTKAILTDKQEGK